MIVVGQGSGSIFTKLFETEDLTLHEVIPSPKTYPSALVISLNLPEPHLIKNKNRERIIY